MAAAYPLDHALPSALAADPNARRAWIEAQIAALPADQRALYESSDFMRGIVETTLSLELDGALTRSPEALYGEDRTREIEDLEAGRHPRALRR